MNAAKVLLSKIPPHVRVALVALAGLGVFVGARLMAIDQVEAEVNYSERYSERRARPSKRDQSKILTADFEGPVPRMARRMRDASGLSLALALALMHEAKERRPAPASVDDLINVAATLKLLPPGINLPDPLNRKPGVLFGRNAALYVRYRPEPFGVEVVSVGNTTEDGPAILIRLPVEGQQGGGSAGNDNPGAALYVLDQTGAVTIPAPFASPGSMLEAGWEEEKFRALDMSEDRVHELNQWLLQMRNR